MKPHIFPFTGLQMSMESKAITANYMLLEMAFSEQLQMRRPANLKKLWNAITLMAFAINENKIIRSGLGEGQSVSSTPGLQMLLCFLSSWLASRQRDLVCCVRLSSPSATGCDQRKR